MNSLRFAAAAAWPLSLLLLAPALGQGSFPFSPTSGAGFAGTHGNKVVKDANNRLHVVYEEGGQILYRNSLDGHQWSAPELASGSTPTCARPAVAVDSTGNLALVFEGAANDVVYALRSGSGWSAPVVLDSGREPAIACFGTTAHVAYATALVSYLTFPTTDPSQATGSLVAGNVQNFSTQGAAAISIVATSPPVPGPAGGQVLVSHLYRFSEPVNAPGPTVTGVRVHQLDPSTSGWTEVFQDARSAPYPIPPQVSFPPATSASMAADASGNVYLAWSDRIPTHFLFNSFSSRTMVVRRSPLGTWSSSIPINAQDSQVDVAAEAGAFVNLRLAWTENLDATGRGVVRYRSGNWNDRLIVQPSPFWTHPVHLAAKTGRHPQALFWNSGRCESYVAYDWDPPQARRIALRGNLFCTLAAPQLRVRLATLQPATRGGRALDRFFRRDLLRPTAIGILEAEARRRVKAPLWRRAIVADIVRASGSTRRTLRALERVERAVERAGARQTITPEDRAGLARGLAVARARVAGGALLSFANIHDGLTVREDELDLDLEGPPDPQLDVPSNHRAVAGLPLPWIAAFVYDTGRADLDGAKLSIAGRPAQVGGPLEDGDGDDYWFAVRFAASDLPPGGVCVSPRAEASFPGMPEPGLVLEATATVCVER